MPEDRELPDRIRRLSLRLTRHAIATGGEAARERRDALLSHHGYRARYREADATLVLYPVDWLGENETVDLETIDDPGRALELPLTGAGAPDDWEAIAEHNARIVERVREAHGDIHGANAAAFADFMNNHRARRIESAGPADVEEFRAEYFPRNAWPTDEQRAALDRSLELVFETVDPDHPPPD